MNCVKEIKIMDSEMLFLLLGDYASPVILHIGAIFEDCLMVWGEKRGYHLNLVQLFPYQ